MVRVVGKSTQPGQGVVHGIGEVDGAGGHGAGRGDDLRGGRQMMVVVLGDEKTQIHGRHRLIEARMARDAGQLVGRPALEPIDDRRSCSAKCVDQTAGRRGRCAAPRASGGSGGRPGAGPDAPARSRPAGWPRAPRGRGGARHAPAPTSARLACRSGSGRERRRERPPSDRASHAADPGAAARRRRAARNRRCGRTSVSRTEMLVRPSRGTKQKMRAS